MNVHLDLGVAAEPRFLRVQDPRKLKVKTRRNRWWRTPRSSGSGSTAAVVVTRRVTSNDT